MSISTSILTHKVNLFMPRRRSVLAKIILPLAGVTRYLPTLVFASLPLESVRLS